LDEGKLRRLLIEAANDTQAQDPRRNLRFSVDRTGFDKLNTSGIVLDYGLLDQAVSNLLDNAAKYGQPGSIVRISVGTTSSQRFRVTVANVAGLEFKGEDLRHSTERGMRGEYAAVVTGEGAGIGLWLVHHLMQAQGGELGLQPTRDGITEVSLYFPRRVPRGDT
jgi:two-component system phosphate regulon sensor histidine kinase PhoR